MGGNEQTQRHTFTFFIHSTNIYHKLPLYQTLFWALGKHNVTYTLLSVILSLLGVTDVEAVGTEVSTGNCGSPRSPGNPAWMSRQAFWGRQYPGLV